MSLFVLPSPVSTRQLSAGSKNLPTELGISLV